MSKKFVSSLLQKIAPAQIKGKESLTVSSKSLNSKPFAISLFHEVHGRLLDVNHWQRYAGRATAHFQLIDRTGTAVNREVKEGDYFQIDIPGPGSAAGDGDDWVKVKKIGHEKSDTEELAYIIVKPDTNPLALNTETAHFFNHEAVSIFFVHLDGLEITTGVLGRNEQPNTAASSIKDSIRNFAIAIGAMLGLSAAQWKALTSGLLNQSLRSHI